MTATASSAHAINLAWLVRLRWFAVAGQLAIGLLAAAMGVKLTAPLLLGVLLAEALSNVACLALLTAPVVHEWWLVAVMVFDTLALTVLLYLTGGPENPFSFLYLVQIALATVVLREAWTWMLVLLSAAGSALLFLKHVPLVVPGGGGHAAHMRFHLRGMWLAFTVTAAAIVYFLMRIVRALASRDADLARAREVAQRQEKLASLATLAAGAAHELATPLSTIAVVAKELERMVAPLEGVLPEVVTSDVRLVRAQVDRCRAILERMAVDAGESAGEHPIELSVADLVAAATAGLSPSPIVDIEIPPSIADLAVCVPPRAIGSALRGLVKNAQEATLDSPDPGGAAGRAVRVQATIDGEMLRLVVVDHGGGMGPDVLARAGEPFFTTKSPGRGMGLGLFLARVLTQRLGGDLQLESTLGSGTRAAVLLPIAAKNHRMGDSPARGHDPPLFHA